MTGKDSIGHNSLIMASGTAASRITGQIRTILLAAAIGTTGMAANAYQAGAMIPQVIFTLVSGGIFNAVLVPQIVRTLQSAKAEDQLNRLITLALALLLTITAAMMAATPLLTMLYAKGDPGTVALTESFTAWCMPQVLFYGLYTVIGQILAAKNRFGAYSWSSVGANIISSAGFIAFILLFGKADTQPLSFWTPEKIALTAGAWTLGVACQALVLFIPLAHCGIRYRPRWGIRGIGLRSMGPVAAWSLGIVIIDQLITIVDTRVTMSAPSIAENLHGTNQIVVAGNATYQNAYTVWMLPYSLIAVSVSTAVFPVISRFLARNDIDGARLELSKALRNVTVIMCFFAALFAVMAVPIAKALLPSVTMHEAVLMSGPLTALALCLPLSSAYLIIQRTFFAFEDGRHPFLFAILQNVAHVAILLAGVKMLQPEHWVTWLGVTITASTLIAFPALITMLRRRFNGRLDGRRISLSCAKAALASIISILVCRGLRPWILMLAGASTQAMNWFQSILICMILGLIAGSVYAVSLALLGSEELRSCVLALKSSFGRH